MAVTFLGYIDNPEEHTGPKRRCIFGCDSSDDITSLPTTAGMTLDDGGKTGVPAPFSYAIVTGGDVLVLNSSLEWEAL